MAGNKRRRLRFTPERAEQLERDRLLIQERTDALRLAFIASELDLAITFCRTAASTGDPRRSSTNIARAQEAWAASQYFLGTRGLADSTRRALETKLSELQSLLAQLLTR